MSEIVIQAMQPDLVESFHEALDSVCRERRYLSMLEGPPLAHLRDFVASLRVGGNPQFVALDGARVVGWCDIRRHDREVHAHRGALGMGIIDGYRGAGLGKRLIDTTLAAAWEIGLHRVELDVHADNDRAIRLYESVGFVREGVAREAVRIDGRFVDVIHMAILRA
ncbi:RimJ/RimL family protein N-acetyltransferase [Rhizobium taibaishanense]|uniref:RimJ/RimL family protein N-acetyltransferase n=2 Tax=Allorhizobium taibaishanense TaxID=887144 RepID=A0A7W6HK48_9HYPH|nr:RimJ/RimL family protein N-acetyltransferase [Allorhizobium taibaishanense]